MRAVDVVLETLAHFVKREGGPPPGIPVRVEPDFERKLVRLCEWHSLSPLVLDSLEKLALQSPLSEVTLGRLKTLAAESGARNERFLAVLRPLTRHLRDKRVPFLLVDDIAVALKLYPRHRLRPIESLDVLVREDDWEKLLGACRILGFRRATRDPIFRDGREAMLYHQCLAPCTLHGDKDLVIGVKFRLIDIGRPTETETAWSLGKRLGRDLEALRVSYEDQFVRSCLAFNMTGFGRLLHAVDAGRIIARLGDELDWSYIEGFARDRRFYPALYFSYETVSNMFGFGAKRRTLPHPGGVRRTIFQMVWHPGHKGVLAERPTTLHRYKFCLLENGTLAERLGMLKDAISPRREWVSAFFARPYKPWLKLRFIALAFANRLGGPYAGGEVERPPSGADRPRPGPDDRRGGGRGAPRGRPSGRDRDRRGPGGRRFDRDRRRSGRDDRRPGPGSDPRSGDRRGEGSGDRSSGRRDPRTGSPGTGSNERRSAPGDRRSDSRASRPDSSARRSTPDGGPSQSSR